MSAIRISVLGDHDPAHLTHRELDAVLARLADQGVDASWVATDAPAAAAVGTTGGPDGVWIAPGSPYRDEAALRAAIDRARVNGIPLLATCGGFQHAAIALAATLGGADDPRHAESDPGASDPFVAPLSCRIDDELREVTVTPGTRLAALLGTGPFAGSFVCGFAPTAAAAATLERAGVLVSAHARDVGPVALELPDHPFFVGTLFHPEMGAIDGAPLSPLIEAFVAAAGDRAGAGVA